MLFPGCGDCCQNPPEPPDFCFCPDQCSYYAEIISPDAAALSGANKNPCVDYNSKEFVNATDCDVDTDSGISVAMSDAQARFDVSKYIGFTEAAPPFSGYLHRCAFGTLSAWASIRCDGNEGAPRFFLSCGRQIICSVLEKASGSSLELTCDNSFDAKTGGQLVALALKRQTLEIELDSTECGLDEQFRTCGVDSFDVRYAAHPPLPLTANVSDSGVNGYEWQDENVSVDDANEYLADSQVLACLEATTLVVKFANRPSCRPAVCECTEPLDGLVVKINGGELEEPAEFVYGTPDEITYEDEDGWRVYYYPGGAGFYIYYYKDDSGENAVQTKTVTFYCEDDDDSDPPVPKWYAIFSSACAEYGNLPYSNVATAATENQEIGYFDCYESSGCAAGNPVPLGTPQDVEQVPGYPYVPGGVDPCDAPERATVELVERCGS